MPKTETTWEPMAEKAVSLTEALMEGVELLDLVQPENTASKAIEKVITMLDLIIIVLFEIGS